LVIEGKNPLKEDDGGTVGCPGLSHPNKKFFVVNTPKKTNKKKTQTRGTFDE
jgi:hypothetical protein